MKKLSTILIVIFIVIIVKGQDITGQWNGVLKVSGMQLRIVFHISESGKGLSAKMDSPDQSAFGIPVTLTTFENPKLRLAITNMGIEYAGELKENLNAIKNAVNRGGNEKVTIKEFPGLNHLFQESKTGLPNEYAEIEQTFSPLVLEEIKNWIAEQIK